MDESHQTFAYRAQSRAGAAVSGTLDAADLDTAQQLLEAMGLTITQIERADDADQRRTATIQGGDLVAFNQQLAHLTQAGLPVESGLRLIAQETRQRRMANTIRKVAEDVERGTPLGEAFNARRGSFPPLYGQLVDAGIASHNLPGMLFNLGRHMELVQRLRAALWQAIAYPLVVLAGMLLVILFLQWVILPQFEEIYEDFDTHLPWLTELLIASSKWMPSVIVAVLIAAVAAPFVWRGLRMSGKDQAAVDALGLPLPLIGPVLKRNLIARWCDAVRLGVDAGLDLPQSIRLASNAIGSPRLHADGEALIRAIETGTIGDSMQSLGVLPRSVMTAIDLSSNQDALSTALGALTDLYRQQAEMRLSAFSVALAPLMLMLLGFTIGFVVIALFLPLVRLMQAVM